MSTTDDTNATRRGSGSNDLLGPLPATGYVLAREGDGYSDPRLMSEPAYTEEQMRAYAAEQVAAERERWQELVAEMRHMAEHGEMPDGDYCSVSMSMWAEDWLMKLKA